MCPHAGAIFGWGETAAFVVLLQVFGDLVEEDADTEIAVATYRMALLRS